MSSPEPTSFIIAEYGADARPWMKRFAVGTPSVVTVFQGEDENASEFAMRVRSTVEAFGKGGGQIARAVLVGGGDASASLLPARSLAVRALVTSMSATGAGSLILDGQGRDRFAMMGLADVVAAQVAGTGVRVNATGARVAAA